ncbi:MAG: NosD domain-containing protein, partial [Anaerolineales bacterium]
MKSHGSISLFVLCVGIVLLLSFLFPLPAHAGGGVFTVNTTDDLDDGDCNSAHCSLREAINAVNTYPGVQYIYFDIPGPGPHEITLCSMLPAISDAGVLIDGTTEPDYSGGIPAVVIKPGIFNISGVPGCNPPPVGLWIATSDVTVRGLSIIGFTSSSSTVSGGIATHMGANITIEHNFIGLDPSGAPVGNREGIILASEDSLIENNRISANVNGIHVFRSDHLILSNFIGTDPTGTSTSPALGNTIGILVDDPSSNIQIGGPSPAMMNVISGNDTGIKILTDDNYVSANRVGLDASGTTGLGNDTGIWVVGNNNLIEESQISDNNIGLLLIGSGNQVSGNFIGTDSSGDVDVGNDTGVHIIGSANIVGGGIPIMVPEGVSAGNIISGNDTGIYLGPNAQDNQIYGNKIGAANSPDTGLPNSTGILLDGADNNTIGSTNLPHEANWVMYNHQDGIRFITTASDNLVTGNYIAFNNRGITAGATTGDAIQNTFRNNSIYTNTELGIDLYPWGVTPNDLGDADFGANYLQNFPVISSATTSTIQGTACLGCTVEVFGSDEDPSGYGEGISPIGLGVTNSSGHFSISVDPLATVGICDYVTATATDANGNTSEFAENFLIGPCFSFTPGLLLFVGVVFVAGGAAAGGRFSRGRGIRAGVSIAVGGVLGGLLGGGLIMVATFIPLARAPFGPPEFDTDLISFSPTCNLYLDSEAFEPGDGEILINESFNLAWDWMDEPQEGSFRWTVELNGPDGSAQVVTENMNVPFLDFGLTYTQGDSFSWRVTAEQYNPDSTQWEPFCEPSAWLPFQIGLSPLLAPPWTLEAEEEPPTPTFTPEASE